MTKQKITILLAVTSTNHCDDQFIYTSFNSYKHPRFYPQLTGRQKLRETKGKRGMFSCSPLDLEKDKMKKAPDSDIRKI